MDQLVDNDVTAEHINNKKKVDDDQEIIDVVESSDDHDVTAEHINKKKKVNDDEEIIEVVETPDEMYCVDEIETSLPEIVDKYEDFKGKKLYPDNFSSKSMYKEI